MTSPITPDRVREIIAAYGGAPQRWPESERVQALALIAADPELARLRTEARSLDELLDSQPVPPAVQLNPVAIAAAARRDADAKRNAHVGFRPVLLRRAAGMAAAALLGFALGIAGFVPLGPQAIADDPVAVQIEEDAL